MNWDKIINVIKNGGDVGYYAKTIKQKLDLDIEPRLLSRKLGKKCEEYQELEREYMTGKNHYKYYWREES